MPYLGIFDQKCLIWEIFGLELKKKMFYLKSVSLNLSCCKFWCKNKIHQIWDQKCLILVSVDWKLPLILLTAKFREIRKMLKFGPKNVLVRYFWARISKKLLSYYNSAPSNLSDSKFCGKNAYICVQK